MLFAIPGFSLVANALVNCAFQHPVCLVCWQGYGQVYKQYMDHVMSLSPEEQTQNVIQIFRLASFFLLLLLPSPAAVEYDFLASFA
jgi:hypothetical protein